MIPISYVIGICAVLIGVALAAIATQRNLIVILLAVELIFMSSTIALAGFISGSTQGVGAGVVALVSIWAVAAIEVITLVAFYVYIKSNGYSLDVGLLSRFKG